MARRRRQEVHENQERWLVSYADLVTLMFAFFVVMYAISSVNEGKFRVLSSSLVESFGSPPRSGEPIQVGDPTTSRLLVNPFELVGTVVLPDGAQQQVAFSRRRMGNETELRDLHTGRDADAGELDATAIQIKAAMAPLIDQGLVEVRRERHWVEVEIKASVLFASGSAQLEPQALPVLEQLAEILRQLHNPIEVEGFTDNVPIANTVFPSNWELSAARSASVVRLFAEKGVQPQRMVVIGFGEYQPIAQNTSEQGRSRNRRVVVSILMQDRVHRVTDAPLLVHPHGELPAGDAEQVGRGNASPAASSLEALLGQRGAISRGGS
ncbi:MAG: flagellar motor protein MotD [Gammaproteobacteria bacterium]